jgi:hypothetical protein
MEHPPSNCALMEALASLPPSPGESKILIQEHRDNRGQVYAHIAAIYDTGQIIGMATRGTVVFGLDENQHVRHHLTQGFALNCLKDCCRAYLGRSDVDFIQEPIDPVVVQAPQTIQPASGMPPHRM